MNTWPLLRSESDWRSPGARLSCHSPRPVTAPVTNQVPSASRSKLAGFALAASGPVMAGVVIAVGAAGASTAGASAGGASSAQAITGDNIVAARASNKILLVMVVL